MLKARPSHGKLYDFTEIFFIRLNAGYKNSLDNFLRRKYLPLTIVGGTIVLIIVLWKVIPAEMAPLEDRSQINLRMIFPEGSTYDYSFAYTEEISALVDKLVPEAEKSTMRVWTGGSSIEIVLVPPSKRKRSQQEIANQLTTVLGKKTKARVNVLQQSTFGGRRTALPVQYVIQAQNIDKLREVLPEFMARVQDNPYFTMADVNLRFTKPELQAQINRDKANILGVSTQNIGQTLQLALSGQRFGYFIMNGKQYQILGELPRNDRNEPLDLKSLYVRNDAGQMVQLDNFVELKEATAPPQLYRYNRFVSATISAGLAEGKTISEGIEEMDKIAAGVLDDTFRTALSGDSKDFMESSSSLVFALTIAIVLIFLVLSAQFESFKDPVIVMMTVPLALAGA